MAGGSIFVRKALGAQLKALRVAAGKTYADVGTVASPAKIKRMEAGEPPIRMPDVRTLCFMYGADTETTERLVEMSLNKEEDWWEDYGGVMPTWLGKYVALESSSSHITTYDAELINGLLQTPSYHRAIFEADADMAGQDPGPTLALRIDRQRVAFERNPPIHLSCVLGEGALARMVGGPEVVAEERAHLLKMVARENIDVYVLPWSSGAHTSMKGAFTILSVDNPQQPDVVYLESLSGARYMENRGVADRYRRNAAILQAESIRLEEYLS